MLLRIEFKFVKYTLAMAALTQTSFTRGIVPTVNTIAAVVVRREQPTLNHVRIFQVILCLARYALIS